MLLGNVHCKQQTHRCTSRKNFLSIHAKVISKVRDFRKDVIKYLRTVYFLYIYLSLFQHYFKNFINKHVLFQCLNSKSAKLCFLNFDYRCIQKQNKNQRTLTHKNSLFRNFIFFVCLFFCNNSNFIATERKVICFSYLREPMYIVFHDLIMFNFISCTYIIKASSLGFRSINL